MTDPSTDPVGTVRDFPRWEEPSYSTYSAHCAVRWTDDRDEEYPWLLLGSEGPQRLSHDAVEGCRVIGAVPGTPAAEPKADQRWRDRQGDVWLETSDVGRLLRLVEFKGQTHLDGSVQEFADVEDTWGPLVLIPQRDDAEKPACSCGSLLTSAGPRRLTAPECPEHGEGK